MCENFVQELWWPGDQCVLCLATSTFGLLSCMVLVITSISTLHTIILQFITYHQGIIKQ